MKRLLLSVVPTLLFVPLAPATSPTYINSGTVSVIAPPQIAPVIDATNFVNRGYFAITNLNFNPLPFETWNTRNWTNFNLMQGNPGFRFDRFDSATSVRVPADNFVNGASVYDSNSTVYGSQYLLISASNVVNRGTLAVDGTGLMKIEAKNIDLTRSTLTESVTDNPIDRFWGYSTNTYEGFYDASEVDSPYTPATGIQNNMYWPMYVSVMLTNGFTAYIQITPGFRTDVIVDALFLGNTNSAITADVRFSAGRGQFGSEKAVRWQSVVTNRFTGSLITNELFLIDDMPFWNVPSLVPSTYQLFNYGALSAITYRPINFQILRAYPFFDTMVPIAPSAFDPTIMDGTNIVDAVTNTIYGASVTAESFRPDPYIHGSTYSNLNGRIELIAQKVLQLANTYIDGQSFLRLTCTNHFAGNDNSRIFSPFTSMNLATTNGTLKIHSLTAPTVPRMAGDIDCWSGRWTNAGPVLGSVMYSVTIVDSRLTTEVPSKLDELTLRSTNIVISDAMNVMNKLLILAERLTIATNAPHDPTLYGEINLLNPDLLWSQNMPYLRYLTNYGRITTSNTVYFGSTPVAPWNTNGYDSPYNSLVTHNYISSQGNDTWANYFESSGTIDAGVGPLSIRAVTAFMTNGVFLAPQSDVTLTSGSLLISNQVINAGRAINIAVTDYLDDGSLSQSVDYITNRNVWAARDGFNLLAQPAHGSLLGTTVSNSIWANANVINRWAGADRGCSEAGFVDNSAVGRLVIDGGDQSLVTFAPVGANNAIYVDRLELQNFATARNGSGDLVGIQVLPGMKIYFAEALADGVSIAEKLNGRNNGAFCWISSYAGFFSSTNMVYPNGQTYRLNAALVQSCDMDSNGNGIVNCLDPAPVNISAPPVIPGTPPPGGGGSGSTNGTTTGSNGLPKLTFPGVGDAGGSVLSNAFVVAQGSYSGLFYENSGVTASRAGYLALVGTARGTFSGRVLMGGQSYPFTGAFNQEGHAAVSINRRGQSPLALDLRVDLTGADLLRGTVGSAGWSADLQAHRATFTKSTHRTGNAGYYTMVIPPGTAAGSPTGYGYGAVAVDAAGNVTWTARLAEGTVVSQKTTLSKQGVWPLYAAPHNGQGLVVSWVQFATNNAAGQVIWIKPAGAPGKVSSAGFTNQVNAIISPYVRPAGANRALELFNGYGKLVFSGGGLLHSFTNTVQIGAYNRVSCKAGPALSAKIGAMSGYFSGTVRNPETGKPLVFQGSLLQDGNFGAGFFINGGMSGLVYLAEPSAFQ